MGNPAFRTFRNSAGFSDPVDLPSGWYSVILFADAWGNATLQVGDGTNWFSAVDSSGNAITATANRAVSVAGGLMYRLNVASVSGGDMITANFYRSAD